MTRARSLPFKSSGLISDSRMSKVEPARTASKISLVPAEVDGTRVTAEKVLTLRGDGG
jgi:hypothetical protein